MARASRPSPTRRSPPRLTGRIPLLDDLPDPVAIVAPSGRIELANKAAQEVLAGERESGQQASLFDAVLRRDHAVLQAALRAVAYARRTERCRVRWRRADRRVATVEVHLRPLHGVGDGPAMVVLVARDLSEQIALEHALRETAAAARAANQARCRFVAHLCHELCTPLNAILGYAQLLSATNLTAEQQEHVQQVLRAGRHLRRVVDDALDLFRLGQGRLRLACEAVSVVHTVREAVGMVAPMAGERMVQLDAEEAPAGWCALADRQRLSQVLLNLLDNAVKYNQSGGRVRVTARRVTPDRVRLAVADTGPGIPPEQQHRLFTPFERLGAHTADGVGIGLALSKSLVEAMGGTMGVESRPGEGSTFWVELPLVGRAPNAIR
ncbi:MAG: ATP-binding protein [Armatimonadota bacterium]|nr:ATP-binding protein [Armatimonadota bacterium]MDR7536761.1 ATP-binding protein [Armatimonadota bacterium]